MDRNLGAAPSRVGASMALTSMCLVQTGIAASVGLFDRLGAEGTAWLRLCWAGVVLLVLGRPWRASWTRSSLLTCLALGVVTAGMMMPFMAAVARIPLGTASALEFLGPLTVAVVRGGSSGRVWSVFAAAGVLLLTEPWHGGIDLLGVALALTSGVCWGVYIVLTQRAGDAVTGLSALSISMPVAAVIATVSVGPASFTRLSWPLVAVGLGLALLLPVIPFALELLALRRLTAGAFGTLMSLEPAVALTIGVLVLGQLPRPGASLGILCVVVAGIGAARTGARDARTDGPSDSAATTGHKTDGAPPPPQTVKPAS